MTKIAFEEMYVTDMIVLSSCSSTLEFCFTNLFVIFLIFLFLVKYIFTNWHFF